MTHIPTTHEIAQKVWRPGVINEAERQSVGMGLVGASPDSPIMLLEDLTRDRGDKIQLKFSPSDHEETHEGFSDMDDIVGNGLDVEFLVDEMIIDYLGESWKSGGMMSQQRTNADIRETCFQKAAVWWSRRFERSILNQAAGFTPAISVTPDLEYCRTGMNEVTAVDPAHIIRSVEGAAAHATDEALGGDPTAVFSLRQLEAAVKQMMSKSYGNKYPVAPCSDGLFHAIIHTSQWAQLREYSNPADWADLQRALLEGGQKWEQSGFLTGALGVYLNVAIHVSDYIPWGVNSLDPTLAEENVRRGVIIGSRGLHMAFGEGYASDGHLDWLESIDDFRKWSVLVDSVFGVKRTEFDGETFGLFVLPSYSDV